MLSNILFIARKDIAYTLRDRFTLVWLLLMPGLFFYFIGTATGGFGSPGGATRDDVAVLVPADAGFLAGQLSRRLDDAGYNVVTFSADAPGRPLAGSDEAVAFADFCRRLRVPPGLTRTLQDGAAAELEFESCSDEMRAQFDDVRTQRAVYTTLADVIAVAAQHESLTEAGFAQLNGVPRTLTLSVRPAGRKRDIPTGFQQAVPGTMVMFTMLVLLTSGAISLLIERQRGLLRRLASAPITRAQIVAGKWLGKMGLAVVQLAFAMLLGTLLFQVHWQPDLAMIVLLLLAWAGLCTSLALLVGNLGNSEGQIAGIGVLSSMLLGGLGGCWWPIEVAPPWMQSLAGLLPTGWTMNGLHKLMSFEAGAAAALPELVTLVVVALLVATLATRRFRYE